MLTGANIYTGSTSVNQGTLQAGAANTFSPASALNVAAGATLALNNFNQTVGSLAGAGSVTLGSATLTAGGNNTSTTFSGIIGGSGGLTKVGTGTLILSGANTYTGATNVNAGVLSVNGSPVSTVNVNNGSTLMGTGIVGGLNVINGMLAPGNSIGTITVNGNLMMTAASTYQVEVSPAAADRTNVTGTATLGGATVSAIYAAGSYVSKRYTILNAAGGVSGTFNTLVDTNLPANFTPSLNYDPNNAYLDLTLKFTPPSPPTSPNSGNGLRQSEQCGVGTDQFLQHCRRHPAGVRPADTAGADADVRRGRDRRGVERHADDERVPQPDPQSLWRFTDRQSRGAGLCAGVWRKRGLRCPRRPPTLMPPTCQSRPHRLPASLSLAGPGRCGARATADTTRPMATWWSDRMTPPRAPMALPLVQTIG